MALPPVLLNGFHQALSDTGVSGLSSLTSLTLAVIVGWLGGGANEGWKTSEGNRKLACGGGLNTSCSCTTLKGSDYVALIATWGQKKRFWNFYIYVCRTDGVTQNNEKLLTP